MKYTTFNTFNTYEEMEEFLINKFTLFTRREPQQLKALVDWMYDLVLSDQDLISLAKSLGATQAHSWEQMCQEKTIDAAKAAVKSLYDQRIDGRTGLELWRIASEVVELIAAQERAISHPAIQAVARHQAAAETAIVVAKVGNALARAAGWATKVRQPAPQTDEDVQKHLLEVETSENMAIVSAWQRFGVINWSGRKSPAHFCPFIYGCLPTLLT